LRGLSHSLTLKHTKDNNPQNNKHRMMLILSRNIHKGQCFFLSGEGQGTKMRAPLKAEERRKGGKEALVAMDREKNGSWWWCLLMTFRGSRCM